jgi:hypothetical protein
MIRQIALIAPLAVLTGAALAQDAPKVVPLSELGLSPRKYADKPIEVRNLICYFADVDEYRCVEPRSMTPVAVFAKTLTPDAARKIVEDNCDQAEKAFKSPRCRVTLRFRFSNDDVDTDFVGNMRERHVVKVDAAEIVPAQGRR